MPVQAHLFISGRVQGVGFRASTQRQARQLGVDGWVKNLSDGRVEAVVQGEEVSVEEMVSWCHDGPRSATVEDVTVEYEEPTDMSGFDIRR